MLICRTGCVQGGSTTWCKVTAVGLECRVGRTEKELGVEVSVVNDEHAEVGVPFGWEDDDRVDVDAVFLQECVAGDQAGVPIFPADLVGVALGAGFNPDLFSARVAVEDSTVVVIEVGVEERVGNGQAAVAVDSDVGVACGPGSFIPSAPIGLVAHAYSDEDTNNKRFDDGTYNDIGT